MGEDVPDAMSNRFCYILIILFFPFNISAQSGYSEFKKLSTPEKYWVLIHPFKAKKAFRITREVLADTDSLKKSNIIGGDNNGGKLDAFKHAYWMACLSTRIGSKRSEKLGIAHEKGNKIQYKKHKLEDAILPDSISSVMDMNNNCRGIYLLKNYKNIPFPEIQKKILNALAEGKLYILKKDEQENFLTCDNKIIQMENWQGKWNIPKCLIASNQN